MRDCPSKKEVEKRHEMGIGTCPSLERIGKETCFSHCRNAIKVDKPIYSPRKPYPLSSWLWNTFIALTISEMY